MYTIPPHLQKFDWYAPHLAYLGYEIDNARPCGANLRRADLRRANLRRANLREANLREADLREADLSGAAGQFAVGSFGKHTGVAAGGYISIGCERHTYQHWLGNYKMIGQANGYSDTEITLYGSWIHLVVSWLEPLEKVVVNHDVPSATDNQPAS